jgi:hypothetical protein
LKADANFCFGLKLAIFPRSRNAIFLMIFFVIQN